MALGMDLAAWRVLLSHRLEAVARADSMRAIREGLLWVLPCLMVSAVFLVLSVLARVLGLPPAVGDMLAGLHGEISRILPLLIAASIGYMLAIRHQLPRLPVAFLCMWRWRRTSSAGSRVLPPRWCCSSRLRRRSSMCR